MRKSFAVAVGAGAMFVASLVSGPVGAQSTQTTQTTQTTTQNGDIVGPHNPYCGAWVNGAFQANGNCVTETTTTTTTTQPAPGAAMNGNGGVAMSGSGPAHPTRYNERVSGQITNVSGHLVTLQHGNNTLIVDDSRALNRQDTGHVATGRDVIAHGYWEDGTFYASSFQ